jgi:hypothetical protein
MAPTPSERVERWAAAVARQVARDLAARAEAEAPDLARRARLPPEAIVIGMLYRVEKHLQDALYAAGAARRAAWLAAPGRRRGSAVRELGVAMGVARTGVYGAFGANAGWRARQGRAEEQ